MMSYHPTDSTPLAPRLTAAGRRVVAARRVRPMLFLW